MAEMDYISRTISDYQELFGDMPDSRMISDEANANIIELARMAIRRGEPLGEEELGTPIELPEDPGDFVI